jgi:cellulose biosynthesis protein BcsQ
MSVPTIALFNNKGGVGKTSLAHHLAWMLADLGYRVLAVDLDPQANLSAAFLDDDRLEELWMGPTKPGTVFDSVQPLLNRTGDIAPPHVETIDSRLWLLVGDLLLSEFEDELSAEWPKCLSRDVGAFRVVSAFWRVIQLAGAACEAGIALIDLGPNLGAINRAALVASDFAVIPLRPDLFSLRGLANVGPRLRAWREDWAERLAKRPQVTLDLPGGDMRPVGYVVLQHTLRLNRPVRAYDRWMRRFPGEYRAAVLNEDGAGDVTVESDPHCLALLKDYRSLMPMAQEVRKPIFHLQSADGAIGSHLYAVQGCRQDFERLATRVLEAAGITLPAPSPGQLP